MGAGLLAFLMLLSSFSLDGARAAAQEMAALKTAAGEQAPGRLGAAASAPLGFGASVLPLAPDLAVPLPLFAQPELRAAPLEISAEPDSLLQTMAALQIPSVVAALPREASAGAVKAAAEAEFDAKRGRTRALEPETVEFSAVSPARLPAPRARSASFPLALAVVPMALGISMQAASPVFSAGARAWSAAAQTALGAGAAASHFAALAAGVAAVAALAWAAAEFVGFKIDMHQGRKVTAAGFEAFRKSLKPEIGELLRIYRPKPKFWDSTYAYAAGGFIYMRPELIASPAKALRVVAHEIEHLRQSPARGPPAAKTRRLWSYLKSEFVARVAEREPSATLDRFSVPVIERALRRSKNSLSLGEDFEVLIVDPPSAGLQDPSLYESFSGKKSSIKTVAGTAAQASLEGPANARRFGAVVLGRPQQILPEIGSVQAKRLDFALKQLDEAFALASRLSALGPELRGQSGSEIIERQRAFGLSRKAAARYLKLAEFAALAKLGDLRAADKFDKQVREFWREVSSSKLSGLAVSGMIDSLYGGMKDKGLAFLRFAPEDRGVVAWEKLLRFWETKDGGQFRVTRVDFEDGGHVLVVRKIEARVGLWLKPFNQGAIKKTVPDASASAEARDQARQAMIDAGFGAELKKFDDLDVDIRAVYGSDIERQEIYVTVPRRHTSAIRNVASRSSILIQSAKVDYEPHLLDSAALQNVPAVWDRGFSGKGGSLLLIGTGADTSHPDFGGRVSVQVMVKGEGEEDWVGHETGTTAIALGNGSSILGRFLGMAKDAVAVVAKVFAKDSPGAGDGEIKSAAVLGWKNHDVLNVSLGSRGTSGDDLAEFLSHLTQVKNESGSSVIVVASNGNAGPFDGTGSQPAAGEHVIAAAGAAKSLDDGVFEISFYSSVGPDDDNRYVIKRLRFKPDITAIGGDVTAKPDSPDLYGAGVTLAKSKDMPKNPSDAEDGIHTRMSGTSMASPMVAGIALLVKQVLLKDGAVSPFVKENLPFAVKAILMRSADDMEVPLWFQGAGFINADAAVKLVASAGREPQPWSWVKRLKEVRALEDKAYQAAEISRSEAQSRFDDEGSSDSESDGEDALNRAVRGNEIYSETSRSFNTARDAALPALYAALKDPVWLVRLNAALVMLNFKAPQSAKALAEAALGDPDARVRRMAFQALAELPGHNSDDLLVQALSHERPDTRLYAAYALARHGDASGVSQITAELASKDKRARFTAVWLSGQMGGMTAAAQSEALALVAKNAEERGNIRHLAAAALFNVVTSNPGAVSARALLDLLVAAGPGNLALTRTVAKVFIEAAQRKPLGQLLREEPLKAAITDFVLKNKASTHKPGALGELVRLLALHLSIPLDQPTPVPDPGGTGVGGVDPALGNLDMLVELPPGREVFTFVDGKSSLEEQSRAVLQAGLEAGTLARLEARLKAALPLSRSLWISVPEHKVYAFTSQLSARGYRVSPSLPKFGMAAFPAEARLADWSGSDAQARIVAIDAPAVGISEAAVMAAIESTAAQARDPLTTPLLISIGVGGTGGGRTPLSRLVNRLVQADIGVFVAAGNEGPSNRTVTSPANAGLPVVVAAAAKDGALASYSSRGSPITPHISWTDYGDRGERRGTGVAAARSAAKAALLVRRMRQAYAARNRALPQGYFLFIAEIIKKCLTPMGDGRTHEVGGGLFDATAPAMGELERRLNDLGAVERDCRFLSRQAGFAPLAVRSQDPEEYRRLKELKSVLGDVGPNGIAPFFFKTKAGGWVKARGAGLEGFIYSKLEFERSEGTESAQLEDYFRYLVALFKPFEWMDQARSELSAIAGSVSADAEKNRSLNGYLIGLTRDLQGRARAFDRSQWARKAGVYMILARAYNRLKPGKNFFESLDEGELARIRGETKSDTIWLLDIFEIGDIRRWGSGGGSPYSIKGYRVKSELGGNEGLKAFIARARAAGMKVAVDEIPNHVSIDSDLVKAYPEALLHIVPPQELSDEEIMAAVPRTPKGTPAYYLIETDQYPENGRRVHKKILAHHPMTDWGEGGMWTDMLQRDFTRPIARQWESDQMSRLYADFGVDLLRRDMAYDDMNVRFIPRWRSILEGERGRARGWVRGELGRTLAEFTRRAQELKGAEFMEDATDASKAAKPEAAMFDEAYAHATELSRSGSTGIYNKSDHDVSMGQIGLYDAMVSRDAGRIRAALKNAAYRRWQRGGAAMVNFIGTHDGGEGNPIDKFGGQFKAAALTALMLRPFLFYNGLEQGVGQKENLIADLSKSIDAEKSIPFDIPVSINWAAADLEKQAFLKLVLGKGLEHRELLEEGVMDVLEPIAPSPLTAWTVNQADGSGRQNCLLMAANYSNGRAGAFFPLAGSALTGLGAFAPRADRDYVLKDYANLVDGKPAVYERAGSELLAKGLYLELPQGGVHLFEIEEVGASAVGRSGSPKL